MRFFTSNSCSVSHCLINDIYWNGRIVDSRWLWTFRFACLAFVGLNYRKCVGRPHILVMFEGTHCKATNDSWKTWVIHMARCRTPGTLDRWPHLTRLVCARSLGLPADQWGWAFGSSPLPWTSPGEPSNRRKSEAHNTQQLAGKFHQDETTNEQCRLEEEIRPARTTS